MFAYQAENERISSITPVLNVIKMFRACYIYFCEKENRLPDLLWLILQSSTTTTIVEKDRAEAKHYSLLGKCLYYVQKFQNICR